MTQSRWYSVLVLSAAIHAGIAAPAFARSDKTEGTEDNAQPPWSMADKFYGAQEMAAARRAVQKGNGGQTGIFIMADRLEYQTANNVSTFIWDAQGWYGGDLNKLWIKTEGDFSFNEDEFEEAEVQALWSRAITTYFDLQAGVRYDFDPDSRAHFVAGVQGLAPQWFEVDVAGFVSGEGDVTARVEAEYDLLVTQRFILQPRVELELSAQDIPELDVGAGVTALDIGLRARYEIVREFAPYIGVEWQAAFGETGNLIEAAGGDDRQTVFVVGVTAWF